MPNLINISFFSFILNSYVVWVSFLSFYHLSDCFSTWGMYISFFKCLTGMFGENRSLKWIHVICHTRDIPLNKKLAKQRLVKIMLVKIEYLNAQCKEHNVNKHNFTLDKKYCLQEKLFLSKKTSLALINSWYMGNC